MHYRTGDLEKENRHPSAIIERLVYLLCRLFLIFARTFNTRKMVKAIFFDIDGTLVSFQTHTVPESTREALRLLREKVLRYSLPPAVQRH